MSNYEVIAYSYFIPIIVLVLFYRKYTTANFDAFLRILRIALDPQKDVLFLFHPDYCTSVILQEIYDSYF